MTIQKVIFRDLGYMGYKAAWDLQEKLLEINVQTKSAIRMRESVNTETEQEILIQEVEPSTQHYFLLVEHPPVYTLGKSGHIENVLISEEERKSRSIEFFKTNRGGDITFHGPQQIVGYPILDLERFYTDIGKYLRNVEEVIIRTMAEYGLIGERSSGETGVWIEPGIKGRERKICAIGVRCSRWITMHGFAFNVNTALSYFDHIIPCGIRNKQVTSLQRELGKEISMEEVKEKLKKCFEEVFDVALMSEEE